jgi:hypothetical protein
MTGPRDWDKDLAAVDKAIESWKATTPGTGPAAPKQAPVVVAQAAEPRKGVMSTWLRVSSSRLRRGGAVLALSAGLRHRPVPLHGCHHPAGGRRALGAGNSWGRRLGNATSCLCSPWCGG